MDDAIPPSTPPPVFTSPPPVMTPPSPSRPARGGRGWMVFAVILLVLLVLSVLVNFTQLAGNVIHVRGGHSVAGTRSAGPRLEESLLEDNNARSKIAVINVNGIITSSPLQQGYSMVDVIKAQLD